MDVTDQTEKEIITEQTESENITKEDVTLLIHCMVEKDYITSK